MKTTRRVALIVGAGPAGLTAAYELLTRGEDILPIVFEKSAYLGGISRTHNYKGNRMDIGGHRFFSKSDRVMDWWLRFMPLENGMKGGENITYQNATRPLPPTITDRQPDSNHSDLIMLLRRRLSRIFYLRKFFDYPITLNKNTIANLGFTRVVRIGCSYLRACLFPIRPEQNLEQFFINRFGRELYRTFFQSYTEKVWGIPCHRISAEWGAQRIKGLSILKTILHAVKESFNRNSADIRQKQTETSLIEQFLYPKFGPGQMWEEVARQVKAKGGEILLNQDVVRIITENSKVTGVELLDRVTGKASIFHGDFLLSTMPIKDLVARLDCEKPANVMEVSQGLVYRDFITVGLLLKQLRTHKSASNGESSIRDCWIYVQEEDVQVGRIQIFNNWSPHMVNDPSKIWVGLEFFCNQGDSLWCKTDEEVIQLAKEEMQRMGFINPGDVLDATVLRVEKTYPAYFGTFSRFDEVRTYLDGFGNLFLMGRNGMHRYNNQDHSMLTAMKAVDLIISGNPDKSSVWCVNTEQEYHEEKSSGQGDEDKLSETSKTGTHDRPHTPLGSAAPTVQPSRSGIVSPSNSQSCYQTV